MVGVEVICDFVPVGKSLFWGSPTLPLSLPLPLPLSLLLSYLNDVLDKAPNTCAFVLYMVNIVRGMLTSS